MATIEICVESLEDIVRCAAAGVDRIELCSALALGGLTPSPGLLAAAARQDITVHVMIRPRAGDFIYDRSDVDVMISDIEAVRNAGLAGVVFGASRPDGRLDTDALSRLKESAVGLDCTLHRVIDQTPDPVAAVGEAITLGFDRILTSGGAASAVVGIETIKEMRAEAAGQIEIMAGGGVSANVVPELFAAGVRAFHASCRTPPISETNTAFSNADRYTVDAGRLSELAKCVRALPV